MEQLGFINEFFDKIKSKTTTVAINISSRSILEVMEIDKSGVILNYTTLPIQYNSLTKELENINDFVSAIKRAFSELGLGYSSKIYVSIPTFIIDNEELPKVDDKESTKMMLMTSVEKNYIFKKYDPAISFVELVEENASAGNVSITYTALRADEYAKIKGVFEDLGMKVIAIDSSYSSLVNGVITTQKVNPNIINNDEFWNILNITPNSFILFSMKGKNLVNVYEEPLAVKSLSEEEVYQVIVNSLDLVIDDFPANQIVVVSQSDDVSAEYLSSILEIDYPKTYIEDNKYRKQLIDYGLNITQSNKVKISLEAVGIANWPFNLDGFKFDFLDAPLVVDTTIESIFIPIGGRDIELTPELIKKISIGFTAALMLIIALVFGLISVFYNAKEQEQLELSSKIKKTESDLDIKQEITGMSVSEFLQINYMNNENYKDSYASIAKEIPDMLWIEEFQLKDDSTFYLSGRSYKMDDILNYYDSLKKLGKFQNLKISTLKISNTPISDLLLDNNSEMIEETTYEFAFGVKFIKLQTEEIEETQEDKLNSKGIAVPPMPNKILKQDK